MARACGRFSRFKVDVVTTFPIVFAFSIWHSGRRRIELRGRDAMFLERLERRKNAKGHTHWALVESYRTGKGSRHRVVAYLGELKKSARNGWAQLGRRLDGPSRPQPSLFDLKYDLLLYDVTSTQGNRIQLCGIRRVCGEAEFRSGSLEGWRPGDGR